MQPDDDVCLCFHVSLRKVQNYLRVNRPRSVSQLSECGNAGTGCGWCRPVLAKLFQQFAAASGSANPHRPVSAEDTPLGELVDDLPAADDYARQRAAYRRQRQPAADPSPPRGGQETDRGSD